MANPPPGAAAGAAAQTGVMTDPYRSYNFKLDVGGDTAGHFTEVTGLGARIETIDFREGGDHQVVHRLAGRVDYMDVTMKYGLTASRTLWDWFQSGVRGTVSRKNVSIILMDTAGDREVQRWNLNGAWVKEWRAASLDALGQELAIETMTLVYETLDLPAAGQAAAQG
ncbi:MAG TPA: phage tail protein [Planctomycetota bacterium]|nr:phage tail protein [Planctomycetota bacterium]